MYNKTLTVILVVIVVAIVGLVGYLGFELFQKNNSNKKAADFVGSMIEEKDTTDNTTYNISENNPLDNIPTEETSNTTTGNTTIQRKKYEGYYVDGAIQIPKTSVSYPVLEKVTKTSLEKSVAVLYGPGLNEPGNTVISGHNYRNGQFFSNNKKLEVGDKIYITGVDGGRVTYTVYQKFETTEDDTSYMTRDTNGAREISLTTCTDDGNKRLILLAKADLDS
mgnify:CR=1 FL=1